MNRDYRIRIADLNADEVDGHVAYTLGLPDLADIPVITGQIPHILAGATESRPYTILVLDKAGAFTAVMTGDERWRIIGRLLDVQYKEMPDGDWVPLGAGRISAADEANGPGRYHVEVSDEGWRARNSRIFTTNTTQLWPAGPKHDWRGFPAALKADGVRGPSSGAFYRMQITAGGFGGKYIGREITDDLIRWIESDIAENAVFTAGAAATGNFNHLVLNYAGTAYKIISFGKALTDEGLASLREPQIINPQSEGRLVRIYAWVWSAGPPPATGEAFFEAPTAAPSNELPMHVGADEPEWGVTGGWIHAATLTRKYFDATGQRYNEASIAAVEANASIPLLALPVKQTPDDPEKWMQDNVWGPSLLIVLRDQEGRRKLVDLRLPQDIDPDELLELNASNANGATWSLTGSDAVNSITFTYLHHNYVDWEADGGVASLDGLASIERETAPFEGDTIFAMGRRPLKIAMHGALEPSAGLQRTAQNARAAQWAYAVLSTSRDLLDVWQDGAFQWAGQIAGSLDVEEGQLVILNAGSLKLPNPAAGARSDLRLARVMSIARHPAHAEIEALDMGPSAQPITAPTVSVEQDATDRDLILVTLSDTPAGAVGAIEVGFSSSATPPDAWIYSKVGAPNGVHEFRDAPGSGYVHARAKSTAPQRIRSAWAYDAEVLAARPLLRAALARVSEDGSATVTWTPGESTLGVRIYYNAHMQGSDPVFIDFVDVDASIGSYNFPAGQLGQMDAFTVDLEPWSGWTGSAVTGVSGEILRRYGFRMPRDFVSGAFWAAINGDGTADLALVVHGKLGAFPVTVEFYKDTPDSIPIAAFVVDEDGQTVSSLDVPELGGVTMLSTSPPAYWAKLLDALGGQSWAPCVFAPTPEASIEMKLKDFRVSSETATQITYQWTRGALLDVVNVTVSAPGSPPAWPETSDTPTAVLPAGTDEYTVTKPTTVGESIDVIFFGALIDGVTFGPVERDVVRANIPAGVPTLDFREVPSGFTSDLYISVSDAANSGGTLFVWVNRFSVDSPDPTGPADGSFAISPTPATVGPATAFVILPSGTATLLHNIAKPVNKRKRIFGKFVTTDGRTTGTRDWLLEDLQSLLINSVGDLEANKIISATQFAPETRAIQSVFETNADRIASVTGWNNGDTVAVNEDGSFWHWNSGSSAWVAGSGSLAQYIAVLGAFSVRTVHIDSDYTDTVVLTAHDAFIGSLAVGDLYVSGLLDIDGDVSFADGKITGPNMFHDFKATGSNPLISAPNVSVNADGSFAFGQVSADAAGNTTTGGTISADTFTAVTATFNDLHAANIQIGGSLNFAGLASITYGSLLGWRFDGAALNDVTDVNASGSVSAAGLGFFWGTQQLLYGPSGSGPGGAGRAIYINGVP